MLLCRRRTDWLALVWCVYVIATHGSAAMPQDTDHGPFYQPCVSPDVMPTAINPLNCDLYLNQSTNLKCPSLDSNPNITWALNGINLNITTIDYYISAVTDAINGSVTCYNHNELVYTWYITVLVPVLPNYTSTTRFIDGCQTFDATRLILGNDSNPLCSLCISCDIDGLPAPMYNWYVQETNDNWVFLDTNATQGTEHSSSYYIDQATNGEKLCFSDLHNYKEFERLYKCVAANVAGSKEGCLYSVVDFISPFPRPGPAATSGPLYLNGESVHIVMDTDDVKDPSNVEFTLCHRNSTGDKLADQTDSEACCTCSSAYQPSCSWVTWDRHEENFYVKCNGTISLSGSYRWKEYTTRYPCNQLIGNQSIEVYEGPDPSHSHSSDTTNSIILYTSVGVVTVLLLVVTSVLVHTCYSRWKFNKAVTHLQTQLDDAAEVFSAKRLTESTPLLPDGKRVEGEEATGPPGNNADTRAAATYGVRQLHVEPNPLKPLRAMKEHGTPDVGMRETEDSCLPSSDENESKGVLDQKTASMELGDGQEEFKNSSSVQVFDEPEEPVSKQVEEDKPLEQKTSSQGQQYLSKAQGEKKIAFVFYTEDVKDWTEKKILLPVQKLGFEVRTMENDAIAGKPRSTNYTKFVKTADKVILVCSPYASKSCKKWAEHCAYSASQDIHCGLVIPVVFEGAAVPDAIKNLDIVEIKAKDEKFDERLKNALLSQ